MKILIDTNVILDVLSNRKEFVENAQKIFKLCELKHIDGYISALSITNIIYIMRKELDNDKIKSILNTLSIIFNIVDLKAEDLKTAITMNFTDYKDAIQSAQATRLNTDYIISRNTKDFIKSKVKAIDPENFIKSYK